MRTAGSAAWLRSLVAVHLYALMVLGAGSPGNSSYVRYDGYKLIRAFPTNSEHHHIIHKLQSSNFPQVTFWSHVNRVKRSTEFHVSPEHFHRVLRKLNVADLKYEVIIHDLERLINSHKRDSLLPQRDFFSIYHRLQKNLEWMHSQSAACGPRCHVYDIGHSFEGRPLRVLQIGNTRGRPSIWIDAGIHAREWITTPTALFIANMLINGYHHNKEIRQLADNFNWYFLPMVNPDGYEYTWTTDRMWRKTRSDHGNRCVGTDANRNFDFFWQARGSSADSCTELYAGPHPFSEPETAALAKFVTSLKPAVFLTLHSFGQLWLSPWGYTTNMTDDIKNLIHYGKIATDELTKVYGTKYTVGSSANVLYTSSGTSRDWAYGMNIPFVYTVELRDTGKYGFLLPPQQIAPTGRETWRAVTSLAKIILKLKSTNT